MSQLDTLVVDATSLYWRTDDAIMTCAKASCQTSATVLASGQPGPPSKLADGVALNSIAVDDTDVYWTSSALAPGAGGVYRCAKTGCGGAPQQIATPTGDGVPWALVYRFEECLLVELRRVGHGLREERLLASG
jgi:hypothetical protein